MEERIPRNWAKGSWVFLAWIVVFNLYGYLSFGVVPFSGEFWSKYWFNGLIFTLLTIPLFLIWFLAESYAGEKSKLYGLKPVLLYLPMVKKPTGHVHFRTKFMWTALVLVLYFILTNIYLYGLDVEKTIDVFESFRAILAGTSGSLMHLGIGPIVTASIIMQLFVGAKMFNIDLGNEEDRAIYQETQKLLVIIMIFVEAIPQVYGYLQPSNTFIAALDAWSGGYGYFWARAIIVIQLFFGSYLVFLMDEVVSKWGIGSGISLFIAAGVSQAIFTGTVSWIPQNPNEPLSTSNLPSGTIPKTFYVLTHFSGSELYNGGIEIILFRPPNPIIALIGTMVIFFLVAYAESMKIELPLAHERARGARGRYPIKLMYSSNIPVILTSALLANVSMWSYLFWTHPTLSKIPVLGRNPLIGEYPSQDMLSQYSGYLRPNTPINGIAFYFNRVNGLNQWLLPLINPNAYGYGILDIWAPWQIALHVVVYVGFMVGMSVIFAKFWIETANMNARAIAQQIQRGGMQIPGFRRDPKVLEKVLEKYIRPVTTFSGAAVGALAAFADLIGTVGNTSGTGVLLTVGILIQFYEAMGREQLMEMHPLIRQFFEG